MLATAENATANWKEEEYSDGKWEAGGLQHHVFHLREVTKKCGKIHFFSGCKIRRS